MDDDAFFDDDVDEDVYDEVAYDDVEPEPEPEGPEPPEAEAADQGDEDDDADIIYSDPVRRRSSGWIASGLLGVEQALYGVRKNEIVMVADAGGLPEPDFEINLTPDPRDATVVLKNHRR